MPIYKIRGIDVDFPFEAYDCQIVYMEKVIQSLQEGRNALLESPTGTGKTLCLLCATLAWRKSFGDFSTIGNEDRSWGSGSQPSSSQSTEQPRSNFPVIIYTSRTHSQLKQVIRELRTSNYRPKMAILGSREQMCIHDEVRSVRGRAQNNACHYVCRKRLCRHHSHVSEYVKKHHGLGNEPFDIEDLVNIGRTKGPCPYYVSRELHKTADILFAPYNYLIDPGNRRSLTGIPWSNAVLIFDEAHNLESICADAASFDLPSSYLTACISEAKQCIDICIAKRAIDKSADKQLDPENYAILRALLLKLEKRIAEVAIESKELGFTRPGNYIYEFLSDLNITYETANMLISTIDNASLLLEEGITPETGVPVKMKGTLCRLESIRDILNIIFRDGGRVHAKYYRFHVQESQPSFADSFRGKGSRVLSWWCFNPGLAMEEFVKLGIRSIILTSGTLSPLDSFAMELNLEFPVRLENPHVISSNQICVGVVPTGPSGYPFNSSYRTRDSLEYKQELGNAIVNFARIVPDGLLVFFPSYYMMDQCIECWKSMILADAIVFQSHASSAVLSTIWERICKHKQPVVEPKQSSLFPHAIEDFETKLRDSSTSGAIFFAVCRGKVSEGLDFADQAGRAVLITGMPFSMKTDPKVRLKREYLDQQAQSVKKDSKALTGEEWYVQQATRAVNQAVGRVLRHRHDYGAIIFCDERFAQQNHQSQMSYWLRPHIKCYTKFGDVVFTLTRFFREKDSFGPLRPKQPEISKTGKLSLSQDKTSSLKSLASLTSLASTAENYVTKSSLVIPAIATDNSYDQFGHIVPANRSNLSNKYINHTSQHSGDQFSFRKRSGENENNKRNSQYQDDEVIDLTGDALLCKKSAEDVMTPISFKKLKLYERSNVMVESRNASSSKLLHNADSTFSLEKSPGDRSSERGNKKISQLPSSDPVGFGANSNYEEAQSHQGGTKSSSFPSGDEETRGSAFLAQVQEKLTATEYKEFVGFMKALKLKTMKISPVLESIARLFSSPGRLSLLKRFKDFVPAKYHDIYEQLLRTHGAADNT
ncbi:regulator of telomere elongation helicase 1 isoform X2 [Ananas comosus]|uniref:Regulator of telomere elongation helicase 1 homolog n=1 Tax=Ananas comosus TaxID=4615 RepID=A0A6P5GB46_ANACO|nr:regulator of telomere elongation helicase 1 isoform X2 [Ananas comosus]